MTCVVSSTSSKVANLIETSFGAGSRGELPRVWCVAFNELSPISKYFIENNSEFKDNLNELSKKLFEISQDDGEKMHLFSKFLVHECTQTRPGVSQILINGVVLRVRKGIISFEDLFTKYY